jgi:hypothetical protein
MKEFSGSRGPFKGWTEARRRRLMRDCLYTLDGLEIIMMSSVLRDADFRRLKPETQKAYGDPYLTVFQDCLYSSALAGFMGSPGDIVNMTYSQQDEFRGKFRILFGQWQSEKRDGNNLRSLKFEDMRNVPGLQLADLLAYESTHYFHLQDKRPDLPPRVPFQALCDYQISMGGAAMFYYLPYWVLQAKTETECWGEMQNIFWSDVDAWETLIREMAAKPALSYAAIRRIARVKRNTLEPYRARAVPKRVKGRPTMRV